MKLKTSIYFFASLIPFVFSNAEQPNVVVFLVDDLGYMDIGANNPNCFYETPN
ncbi:MAG: sulfatase, partial [Verrucomicrobiia bacterium]